MLINTKGIGTVLLDLEYDTGKINNIIFKQVYYLPRAPKLLTSPQKWAYDRGEYKVGREGTYLEVMGKCSILVWNNGKSQRIIPHATGCAPLETSTNKGHEGMTKFYSMFAEIFKESDRVHACPEVSDTQ